MRYAHNLAAGKGLCWNPGQPPVEGITNPGWTLVMAAIHLLPLPLRLMPGAVQLLSLAILIGVLAATRRLADVLIPCRPAIGLMAAGLIAAFFPLTNWSLQGMETGLLALLFTMSAAGLASSANTSRPLHWPYLALFAASFVRLDAALPLALIPIFAALVDKARWRRHIAWGWGLLGASLVLQTTLRLAYYGDILPNTYYLKMTGFPALRRVARGLAFTAYYAAGTGAAVALPWAVCALIQRRQSWRGGPSHRASGHDGQTNPPTLVIPFAFIAMQVAYSVYVDGDAWERVAGANRFLVVVAPHAMALLAFGLIRLHDALADPAPRGRCFTASITALCALAAVGILNTVGMRDGVLQLLQLAPPLYREDNVRNIALADMLQRQTHPGATIAIDYAGTCPYFCDRPFVDLLGKSDRIIAKEPAHRNVISASVWREFYPGHLKWDYAYSIGKLKPDVVCAMWRRSRDDADAYLDGAYVSEQRLGADVYWRKDSPRIVSGRGQ